MTELNQEFGDNGRGELTPWGIAGDFPVTGRETSPRIERAAKDLAELSQLEQLAHRVAAGHATSEEEARLAGRIAGYNAHNL